MYKPVDPKISFPKAEEEILKFWEQNGTFKQSIAQRESTDGDNDFVFYDGPPFATGLPHFGHFVPSTIKDIIPRYQTMKGRRVERRFGWDCHGLPVENLIEKELRLNSKTDGCLPSWTTTPCTLPSNRVFFDLSAAYHAFCTLRW